MLLVPSLKEGPSICLAHGLRGRQAHSSFELQASCLSRQRNTATEFTRESKARVLGKSLGNQPTVEAKRTTTKAPRSGEFVSLFYGNQGCRFGGKRGREEKVGQCTFCTLGKAQSRECVLLAFDVVAHQRNPLIHGNVQGSVPQS